MIGPNWKLSPEDVTRTTAILALRRVGKTYTANVIAEEMFDAGVPWVALDPTGAWWGLRSSANGKGSGLPVVILGGAHGDVPLEEGAGNYVAELVIDEPGWYVIDFSLFDSAAAERRFATDFATRLYRRKLRAEVKTAMHLFVDEADRFVAQRPPKGEERMLGAFEALVRRAGMTGIGTTLISQRAAVVNKNVLEQLDQLVMLRTTGPNDRKALDAYLNATATPEQRAEWKATIASLPTGTAWRWEPHGDVFEQVKIRERRTFNSSATPKAGAVQVVPSAFAAIDLGAVKERMAATIERAKADDPKLLRAEIAQLKRELAKKPAAQVERVVETIERIPEGLEGRLIDSVTGALPPLREALEARITEILRMELRGNKIVERGAKVSGGEPPAAAPEVSPAPALPRSTPADGTEDPGKSPRRILSALESHGGSVPKDRLALLIGMTASGGSYNRYLSTLRTLGYAEGSGTISITDTGRAWATDAEALPAPGADLLDWWCAHRTVGKSPARMLRALAVNGGVLDKDALAVAVEMEVTGGSFNRYLSTLRSLGLIEGSRTIELAEELRG